MRVKYLLKISIDTEADYGRTQTHTLKSKAPTCSLSAVKIIKRQNIGNTVPSQGKRCEIPRNMFPFPSTAMVASCFSLLQLIRRAQDGILGDIPLVLLLLLVAMARLLGENNPPQKKERRENNPQAFIPGKVKKRKRRFGCCRTFPPRNTRPRTFK